MLCNGVDNNIFRGGQLLLRPYLRNLQQGIHNFSEMYENKKEVSGKMNQHYCSV